VRNYPIAVPILCLSLVSFALAPVSAQAISGMDAPDYVSARAAWLADDEQTALPALSHLARGGNVAAQMLIALIDKSPALQGPWLSSQSRQARAELMRAPGGLSGTSWMRVAAQSEPLAETWVSLWSVDAPVEIVLEFATAGEIRAAREAAIAIAAREQDGFSRIGDDPDYPGGIRVPVWQEWRLDPARAERTVEEIASLHPGDPQRHQIGEPVSDEDRAEWLHTAQIAAPLRTLCDSVCPDEPSCVSAAYSALPSYAALLTFGSPSETLVPAALFDDSPRANAALLRQILLSNDARRRRILLQQMRVETACLATALETEMARYYAR
jgi:hypothetical protein